MYKDLTNKVAVVTGGSKGIGKAICERFGKEKMCVVVNYHSDEEGAQEAVAEIEKNGGKAVAVEADVSTEERDGSSAQSDNRNIRKFRYLGQ